MTFCYINLTKNIPPRDAVYLDGLRQNGIHIIEILDSSKGLSKFWNIYKKHSKVKNKYDIMWVGYTAHILVPFARLISRKKIIFNALCSLYEGIILSREQAKPISLKALYCWLVDFMAFHSATVSLIESTAQKNYLNNMFFLSDKKLAQVWTGANTKIFYYDQLVKKFATFTVLFRGMFLPESGVEYIIEAAHILKNENIHFRIIGSGMMENRVEELIKKYGLKNLEWIPNRPSDDELRIKMQECHVSLGQLSNHDRLNRTIPHKAFESLAMKVPYLTARNKAVLELLQENETCFCCNQADAQDLAKKIIEIKNNPELSNQIAENAYSLYNKELTPKVLAQNLLANIAKYL